MVGPVGGGSGNTLANRGFSNRINNDLKDDEDNISVPSDLSKDEWAEIVEFNKKKYEQDRQKEKEELKNKKEQIKATLDR